MFGRWRGFARRLLSGISGRGRRFARQFAAAHDLRNQPGDIHAEAAMLRLGRRLAVMDVRLWTEGPDRLAAQANVTYAIPG